MLKDPVILSIIVPVIAGSACLALPDRAKVFTKALALLASLFAFAQAILVFIEKPVTYSIGRYPVLYADNLSAFIALAVSAFGLLVIVYSFGFTDRSFGKHFGYMLITLGSSVGAAFANDMTALLVFWGILAAMMYLLVNLKGTESSAAAAKKAIIIVGATDALMLFGICLVWSMARASTINNVHLQLSGFASYAAYFSIAIAAFAKAGAMPFHSWLPDVAESAPANVTAYLPAALDKLLGIYLLARVSLDMFTMNGATNFILAFAGSMTIVFAVLIALVQHDMKRLLGYHAVSQVGYMVLGIGTGSVIGIAGALFHMLNNAIYKSCLFLTAGAVEKRTGTTDMSRLGGLSRHMPATFVACLVASLSISGIPPLNGFVSKWMIYQGIIESATPKNPAWIAWLVCAMFGSALTIASFMKLLYSVFMGRPDKDLKGVKEIGISMALPMVVMAIACIIFGIFAVSVPIAFLIGPSVRGAIAYLGIWNPALATALVVIAIGLGAFAYLAMRPAKFRTTGIFIGGEDVNKLDRITGTEFYNTVKDINSLGNFYNREESGSLDLYNISARFIRYFTGYFQRLHNGILPTYMVWCLLGMIGMFAVIFMGR